MARKRVPTNMTESKFMELGEAIYDTIDWWVSKNLGEQVHKYTLSAMACDHGGAIGVLLETENKRDSFMIPLNPIIEGAVKEFLP